MKEPRILKTVKDVTPDVLLAAEMVLDSWFPDTRIDWEEFIDRLAVYGVIAQSDPFDFEEYENPAIGKIQRHIRKCREGQ